MGGLRTIGGSTRRGSRSLRGVCGPPLLPRSTDEAIFLLPPELLLVGDDGLGKTMASIFSIPLPAALRAHLRSAWRLQALTRCSSSSFLRYCTGGIRCEKASAYLRSKGVDDVYQLKGGIHRYLEAFPDGGLFQGKNFVFDKRVSLEGEKGSSTVVGKCRYCEAPHDEFSPGCVCCVCRDLVLVCGKCQASHDEYHCRTHSHLGDCYFAHLGRFTAEQLREQRGKLQELHDGLLGRVNKNKRRTLTRQIARVDERLAELSAGAGASGGAAGGAGADGDASGAAAPTLCRTCHREGCPGECWGFWAKSGAPAPTELHPALPVVPTASDAGGAAQKRKRTVSAGDAGRDNRTRTDE